MKSQEKKEITSSRQDSVSQNRLAGIVTAFRLKLAAMISII